MNIQQLKGFIATAVLEDKITENQVVAIADKFGITKFSALPEDQVDSFYAEVIAMMDKNG